MQLCCNGVWLYTVFLQVVARCHHSYDLLLGHQLLLVIRHGQFFHSSRDKGRYYAKLELLYPTRVVPPVIMGQLGWPGRRSYTRSLMHSIKARANRTIYSNQRCKTARWLKEETSAHCVLLCVPLVWPVILCCRLYWRTPQLQQTIAKA